MLNSKEPKCPTPKTLSDQESTPCWLIKQTLTDQGTHRMGTCRHFQQHSLALHLSKCNQLPYTPASPRTLVVPRGLQGKVSTPQCASWGPSCSGCPDSGLCSIFLSFPHCDLFQLCNKICFSPKQGPCLSKASTTHLHPNLTHWSFPPTFSYVKLMWTIFLTM